MAFGKGNDRKHYITYQDDERNEYTYWRRNLDSTNALKERKRLMAIGWLNVTIRREKIEQQFELEPLRRQGVA